MRRRYFAVLKQKARQGKIDWFLKQGWKYLAIPLSFGSEKTLTGPALAGIVVTYRCNSRCIMCDLPTRAEKASMHGAVEMGTDEIKRLIDEIRGIGASGLVFTGGEPLLRNDIVELIAYAKNKGLLSSLSTNGYLLDENTAARLIKSGLTAIGISLDGVSEQTTAAIRGANKSLKKASEALDNLIRVKRKLKSNIFITVAAVLSKLNLTEILPLVEHAKSVSADAISINLTSDICLIENTESRSQHFKITDKTHIEQADEVIDKLIDIKKQEGFIDGSVRYFRFLKRAIRGERLPIPCYARVMSDDSAGNIHQTPLKKFWYSKKYHTRRAEISKCGRCYFTCQMEFNLLYEKLPGLVKKYIFAHIKK